MNFSQVKSLSIPEGDVRRIEINGVTVWQRIPIAYQEVEWIANQATKNQDVAIDTGVIPSNVPSLKIELDVMPLSRTGAYSSSNGVMLGCRSMSKYEWCIRESGGYFGAYTYDTGNILTSTTNVVLNERYTIVYHGNSLSVNDNTGTTRASATSLGYPTNSIYLFRWNDADGYTNTRINYRLYSCKIYSHDVLIRDFIPCYEKADTSNIGLYDYVSGTFHGIVSGTTGNLIRGEDV